MNMKRIISLALCLVMAASMMPVGAFAQDTGWKDCHPAHDDSCGYAEAVEGSPCTHEHTASCYVNNCTHDHVADCYSDGILPGEGEDKTADVCLHACSQESGCVTLSCLHDQGIHDGSCGYAAAVAGSACNHSCELCDPGCVCETKCAEGTPNPDCPVCGAAGADLSECTGKEPEPVTETQKTPQAQVQSVLPAQNQIPAPLNGIDEAVQNVQNQIDALPSVEELEAMSLEKQQAVYEQVRAANDAYEKLTEEEQAQIGKTKIDALFEYFSGLTVPAASGTQTANSVARVGDIYYDDLAEALNNATGQFCEILKDTSLSGTHTLEGGWIELNGYTISGEFTLVLKRGDGGPSSLYGPGTINGNVEIRHAMLNAPLTINGNISQAGTARLSVWGSGILWVNGDIADFEPPSEIGPDVTTIICTGTCSVTDIPVITNPQNIALGVSPDNSGTVTAAGQKVAALSDGSIVASAGSTVTLTAAANQGYRFQEWQVTSVGATINNNTFTMPDSDVSITAVFEPFTEIKVEICGEISAGAAGYGASVNLAATVTDGNLPVNGGTVDFYRGEVSGANKISNGSIPVSNGTAKLEGYQLSGEAWKPSDTPYTITAVYTPAERSDFQESRGTSSLTVSKASQTAPTVSMTQRTADSIAVSASGSGQVELQCAYAEGADGTAPTEDSAWGTTNTFTGLKAGTAYTVFARYAGNDCYNASPAGSTTVYTLPEINTAALPEGTVGVAYTDATLTANVSTGTEVTWSAEGLPKGLSLNSGTGAISGTPTEAGDHTVTVKAAINGNASNTKNLTLTVNMGTADIQITSGSGTYSYGDTITISGTIAASPTASGSNSLTPPAQNQAALFLGTDQLTQAVNVEADGSFTLSYSTGEKEISLGANTLTVKYGGSGNLNAGSENVSITLKAKAVTAQVVVNPITKVYDGNTKATVTLGFQAGDILAGDEITVTAPDAAYASPDAGTRDIVLGSLVIAGKDQNWYAVAAPAGVTGTITQAQITGKVTISGRAALGQILTAVYSGSDPVAYQWLRNGVEIAGATGSSYTLELADVGQQIRAVVAAKDDNYKGSITSATVSVEKLPQEAPETAPKLSRRNRTTIILRAVGSSPDTNAKAEYGISYDGGQTWHWQESRRFEGLKANTTYTFALRYQATDTYEASPRSETVKITTTNTAETNPWTGDQIATAVLVMVLALAGLAVLTAREIIKRKKK